jgi:hypothetical protein
MVLEEIKCINCGGVFTPSRLKNVTCSSKCYRKRPDIKRKYYDKTNAYQKKHAREYPRRYQKLIHKSKHENRIFNINYENCLLLWKLGCHYCSVSLDTETGCGFDRLDNNGGYTVDNVVPCCGKCNQIKNKHLTHDEMIVAMRAVLELRKERQ